MKNSTQEFCLPQTNVRNVIVHFLYSAHNEVV